MAQLDIDLHRLFALGLLGPLGLHGLLGLFVPLLAARLVAGSIRLRLDWLLSSIVEGLEADAAVLSAGLLALEDMQQGHRVHRTLASATGSGKSSMAACFASALLQTTDVPVLLVCPDIKTAEDTYFELVKLIDPQDIVIWTSGHDAGTDLARIRSEQGGFEPKAPRFWKSDLERRKLSIGLRHGNCGGSEFSG